jgi:hypothetical protein
MTGAEVVMAMLEEGPPRYHLSEDEPRGIHATSYEEAPIGNPPIEDHALDILSHIAEVTKASPEAARPAARRVDVKARLTRVAADLNGYIQAQRGIHSRSLYCVVPRRDSSHDREFRLSVFRKIRELVPELVFVELDPDAPSRQVESTFRACLVLRYRETQKK